MTDEEQVRDLVNNGGATFYIGFDCTADSLTAGHFMALTLMKRLQMAGNKPIALIGGGTTMIGDPSGQHRYEKDAHQGGYRPQRGVLPQSDVEHFIEFGEGKAMNDEQRRLAPEA